ncbi:MAG: enoyl-CoA hydratase [Chloroflexi bacterium]|nr:enoyl-CoA hydratase [Chloroflexota bacterium]
MDYPDIIYTKEKGIATVTLNRPDSRNSFSGEMLNSVLHALDDSAKDKEIKVLVITGKGPAFCAGADVKAMAANTYLPRSEDKQASPAPRYDQLAVVLRKLDKPVIASINGVAAGGGLYLACSCDIRIASDRARFSAVNIRRGTIPGNGGSFLLPRLVGIDRACLLIWTGDMVDAREAERIGLVTMVVPHEELEIATRELAMKLAKGPPLAIQKAKRAIYDGLTMDLESHLDYVAHMMKELRETEDHKEGARAFVEKREPVFKGR